MRRALSRLRWQLTLSHLVAIAVTLVSMIAAVLLITALWWTHTNDPRAQSVEEARAVAFTVARLARSAADTPPGSPERSQLTSVLQLIRSGDLAIAGNIPSNAPEGVRAHAGTSLPLENIAYVAIVGRDGGLLASSDPAGSAFAPAEQAEWSPLVSAALAGSTESSRLLAPRPGNNPPALGAYPIVDADGVPQAAVVLASTTLPPAGTPLEFWQVLVFFGAATLAFLIAASLFAFASSTMVSYFLSRRLVRRLEHLGLAAEAFAAGDLTRRVEAGSDDEVGELAVRFNTMADRLSETLEELAAEKRAVETTLQAKRDLVANVSHELRTPLASIRGHTESLLLRQAGDAELRRYLEVIDRQSQQLNRLIDDLFLLSTTESGALSLVSRPLVLQDVIEEVVSGIQPIARAERRVQLLADVRPDLAQVMADRQRVAQILANLIRNAVRHTPEGGLVAVRAFDRDGRSAGVVVEDTGEGIPPDDLKHVFERFYRVDASRDRGSGGAGLGLAIVRELVVAMGGEVTAESVPGEGSRFGFTLPFVEVRLPDVDELVTGPRLTRHTTPSI
jgi:signal transduction histidine kinase/type II secretory pathway pseudopilin PulG